MAEFTKLKDGSLILRGKAPPAPPPGLWQRLRGAIGLMPVQAQEPSPVPWWMNIPPPATNAPAASAAPAAPPPTSVAKQWEEVEKEMAHRDALNKAMGEGPKRILANPYLIGERGWLR